MVPVVRSKIERSQNFYDWIKPLGGFPFFCDNTISEPEGVVGNIWLTMNDQIPQIPVLPWNDYPGVDSDRDYMVPGAGIWGGPDLDCSCATPTQQVTHGTATLLSNLSWETSSGNHPEESSALKCCSSGNEGMTGYDSDGLLGYICDGLQNDTHPNYQQYSGDIEQGCFYDAYIENIGTYALVGGILLYGMLCEGETLC